MIALCEDADVERMYEVINAAARAYERVIPPDRWHEPYMPLEELRSEIEDGVVFLGYSDGGELLGVMGSQEVQDVTLIRHAYVRTIEQHRGIGGALLAHLLARASTPLLVGTWVAAAWAVRFYEHRGFELVTPAEKNRLLRRYWTVPERQIETSVVLARGWTD